MFAREKSATGGDLIPRSAVFWTPAAEQVAGKAEMSAVLLRRRDRHFLRPEDSSGPPQARPVGVAGANPKQRVTGGAADVVNEAAIDFF